MHALFPVQRLPYVSASVAPVMDEEELAVEAYMRELEGATSLGPVVHPAAYSRHTPGSSPGTPAASARTAPFGNSPGDTSGQGMEEPVEDRRGPLFPRSWTEPLAGGSLREQGPSTSEESASEKDREKDPNEPLRGAGPDPDTKQGPEREGAVQGPLVHQGQARSSAGVMQSTDSYGSDVSRGEGSGEREAEGEREGEGVESRSGVEMDSRRVSLGPNTPPLGSQPPGRFHVRRIAKRLIRAEQRLWACYGRVRA